MKTLTKEQVYVVIENQADCDRAIEILTKAGEKLWKNECAFDFCKEYKYLVKYTDGEWFISYRTSNRTQITLDELESLLKPKTKTLTKEDLPIGTKVVPHNKTVTGASRIDECDHWNSEKAQKQGFLYVSGYTTDGALKLNEYPNRTHGNFYNYSDITLYEPTPKIKKSELMERIEVLEKKVADLEEKAKLTIVHPPIWATEPGTVIGKGTIEGEADKPQFEVGKVYKDRNIMFYCTMVNDEKPFGFGFAIDGNWYEDDDNHWGGDFTEATPEEWFKRLEEEAKKRGFKEGVKFRPNDVSRTFIAEGEISVWEPAVNFGLHFTGSHGLIMNNGKWAEIIQEPKFEIGTIGIFWDGDFEEQMSKNWVLFGELDHITENGHFRRKGASWSWYNFKPIKID